MCFLDSNARDCTALVVGQAMITLWNGAHPLHCEILQEKEVSVQWTFGKDDRLIDIFVEKRTVTY
ncbi:MAG: hypothetical protein DLM73_00255 [Chthoniobacterales bacterium]|nr:MAG: hypothetical protein DLM73_00255 [Chthoniobacterales bacterium]